MLINGMYDDISAIIDTAPSYFEITLKKGNAYIQILHANCNNKLDTPW